MNTPTFEDFVQKLKEVFDTIDKNCLTPETHFRDLADWTSINAMILVAMYETEYNRNVSFDTLRQCETIQDLYRLI